MTPTGWLQIAVFFVLVLALTRPLGAFLYRVFEDERRPLPRLFGPVERLLFRLCGVDPAKEQTWREYTIAMLLFSALGLLVTYAIQRLQHLLPLNPQKLAAVAPDLAFNTAASFTTNTNWQAYSGESAMSYFTQMAGLAWHNFTSAAVGIGIALAVARGLTRRRKASDAGEIVPRTLGNFWADLLRAILYVLLPACLLITLVLVQQGTIQTFAGYPELTSLEGIKQTLAFGPVASQEAIKQLGTNGGGFFNANSAHPFENPTPLTNFLQMLLIFAIPAALTNTYGRMARDQKQGWGLFAAMSVLFLAGVVVCYAAESRPNTAFIGVNQSAGNLEGKETRFGVAGSALFAVVTTDASCGAVNSMHDSFTPLGGLVPMANIMTGEVIFGGVGAGLYGMLLFAILAVFIAGLMVGRTPEYLGKKVEAFEVKMAMLAALVLAADVLLFTALASVTHVPHPSTYWNTVSGTANALASANTNNSGPHGFSEMLYAYDSTTGNNGSAFAGLSVNTPYWNLTQGISMLVGRFLMIVPLLAIAGSMVKKKRVAASAGTFPTDTPLFAGLLVGVIVIVGALTYFPAVSLGPIVEHFLMHSGKTF